MSEIELKTLESSWMTSESSDEIQIPNTGLTSGRRLCWIRIIEFWRNWHISLQGHSLAPQRNGCPQGTDISKFKDDGRLLTLRTSEIVSLFRLFRNSQINKKAEEKTKTKSEGRRDKNYCLLRVNKCSREGLGKPVSIEKFPLN